MTFIRRSQIIMLITFIALTGCSANCHCPTCPQASSSTVHVVHEDN